MLSYSQAIEEYGYTVPYMMLETEYNQFIAGRKNKYSEEELLNMYYDYKNEKLCRMEKEF